MLGLQLNTILCLYQPQTPRLPLPPLLCKETFLNIYIGIQHSKCPLPPLDSTVVNLELTSFLADPKWSYVFTTFTFDCLALITCVENSNLPEWSTLEYFLQRGIRLQLIIIFPNEESSAQVGLFRHRFAKTNATAIVTSRRTWKNYPHCRWEVSDHTADSMEPPEWPQFHLCEPVVYKIHDGGYHPPFAGVADKNGKPISPCSQAVSVINMFSNLTLQNVTSNLHITGRCSQNYRELPTGVFAQVLAGDLDVLSCHWAYLELRNRYLQFTYNDESTGTLFVQGPIRMPQSLEKLALSLDIWTWSAGFISMLLMLLLLQLFRSVENSEKTATQGFRSQESAFYLARILLQQSPSFSEAPNRLSQRCLYTTCWLFALVLATAFSSSLVSQMTFPSKTKPIDSVEEIEQSQLPYNFEANENDKYIHPVIRVIEQKYSHISLQKLSAEGRIRRFHSLELAFNATLTSGGATPTNLDRGRYADNFHTAHVMKESFRMWSGVFYRPHLFGIASFQEFTRKLAYIGHRKHWNNIVLHHRKVEMSMIPAFEVQHIANESLMHVIPVIELWIFGLALATFVLLLECVIHKTKCSKVGMLNRPKAQIPQT